MDRGYWQATVYRVTQSQTWLNQLRRKGKSGIYTGVKTAFKCQEKKDFILEDLILFIWFLLKTGFRAVLLLLFCCSLFLPESSILGCLKMPALHLSWKVDGQEGRDAAILLFIQWSIFQLIFQFGFPSSCFHCSSSLSWDDLWSSAIQLRHLFIIAFPPMVLDCYDLFLIC